jgi:glycosyltransferase involved in cell wall biosynthesis
VIHVTSRYPPDLGGMERVASELSEVLAAEIDLPLDVVTGARPPNCGVSREGRLVVRRLRSFNLLVTPIIPGLAWELLHRPRPVLFHVHVAHAGTPEMVALVARMSHVPFVAHVHIDAIPSTWLGRFLAFYQKFILRMVLAHAALVIVPTEGYRELIAEKYQLDLSRVRVLPNGTDMPKREPEQMRSRSFDEPVRLLNVGRVTQAKNLPLLIDAVAVLVDEEHVDVQLEIVGDGPAWDEVAQHIADLGLESRVSMVGRRDGADLIEAYDRADVFVMTSLSDSFGMVLVEAMARGIPTIAPDIVGVRDVVIDEITGLLVEHRAEAVSGAVLRVLREPGLREVLISGARAESHRYEWPQIGRMCADLYEEVLQVPVRNRKV